jgi:hypothetical protein
MQLKQLSLPFAYHVHCGVGKIFLPDINIINQEVFSDEDIAVIVRHEQQIVGLFSFDCGLRTVYIRQLQGFRGVNLKGKSAGEVLLPYAIEVAKLMGYHNIAVLPAGRNNYWKPEDKSRCKRLISTYSKPAEALGFSRGSNFYLKAI